jgi:hypothetical protein
MIQNKSLEFVSKYCRQGPHSKCHGAWTGLGFVTNCNCVCHKNIDKALARVEGPKASAFAVTSSSGGSST